VPRRVQILVRWFLSRPIRRTLEIGVASCRYCGGALPCRTGAVDLHVLAHAGGCEADAGAELTGRLLAAAATVVTAKDQPAG
jgi:hypothetical protein